MSQIVRISSPSSEALPKPAAIVAQPNLAERVARLREAMAHAEPSVLQGDWGNFGNDWGQGGGFGKQAAKHDLVADTLFGPKE